LTTSAEIASNRIHNVAPILRQAWRLLMENHPHDSICGCSIDQVHDEMKPRFDEVDQIGEEITHQALQAISSAVDTRADDAFSAIVLFNPQSAPRRDILEVALNIPETVPTFELLDADKTVIPYEFIGASNQEITNLVLGKNSLRDTIGAITEGRVAGAAITQVKVSRYGDTVTIDAILDNHGQPNIPAWRQAEENIARYEADPAVVYFHVLAHTPRASRICFVSPQIPALGWNTLWVRAVADSASTPPNAINPVLKPFLPLALRVAQSELGEKLLAKLNAGDETKPPFVIQNESFIVEASPSNGTLTVTDKRTNATFNGLNRFMDGGDAGDEYNYSPPDSDSFLTPMLVSLKVFRHGLVQTLEIEYALKVPVQLAPDRKNRSQKLVTVPIHSRVILIPGGERIDIHTEVENIAKDHRLRVHFSVPISVREADHDGHFEVVRRSLGVPQKGENWVEDPRPEVPQRAFTDVSNGEIGLTIANRGLPEVEVRKGGNGAHTEIALTLLRCVGWLSRDDMPVRQGHAGPAFETPGGQMMGKWLYDYSIIPHKGDWRESYQQAYGFQTTLRAIETGIHAGIIPTQGAFISSLPDAFVVSAVKATDNGKGWLVRGYNISSETIQFSLKPLRRFSHAAQVNLAEEEISPLPTADDGSVAIFAAGHKIVSVMFSD
jgi:mannosylglycerate hydrolase